MIWLFTLLACSEPELPAPPIRPVRTLEVQKSGGALQGVFTGTTRAGDEATLSFRTAGTIDAVVVSAGDRVKADDLLARLDATDLQLQYQQANASVAQAEANAGLARRSLQRVEQLYVDDNASAADVDGARAQAKSANAGLVSAMRQRSLAERQLESAELRATRAGQIAQVLAKANENVGGGTPIVVLTPEQALQVTIAV
ncbi:MAG: multidrug efflux system membrane fusion protein, partial [Myxococcota bacterium]